MMTQTPRNAWLRPLPLMAAFASTLSAAAAESSHSCNFTKVKRAQWIGEALGEPAVYGLHGGEEPGFWHAVAIAGQDRIADQVKANKESRSSGDRKPQPEKIVITEADRQVVVDSSGVITIPAVATKIPEENTAVPGWGPMEIVTLMESNLGGRGIAIKDFTLTPVK